MGLIGWFVFDHFAPKSFKEEVTDRISLSTIPGNYIRGKTALPQKFEIDIKHMNLQKLAYVRARSLQRGILYDFAENSVPGVIKYNGEPYRVNLSIKGILRAHWEDEDMYSLKIKVKDGKTIMGMKTFAIQHPSTRNYISEFILHKIFSESGIASLRYDFVSVSINGKQSRIYALEEGFEKRLIENNHLKEGPILKFESGFRKSNHSEDSTFALGIPQDFWSAKIVPMPRNASLRDSVISPLFEKSRTLLESFRQGKLNTSQVFDIPKLSMFFALGELFGSHHLSSLDNIRFYFNPITFLIEPITHDNDHLDRLAYHGILGSEKIVQNQIEFQKYEGWWKRTNWYEAVFKDRIFFEAYIQALSQISSHEFLDSFFVKNNDLIREKQKILHRDYPLFKLDPSDILYENQSYIREALNPKELIQIEKDVEVHENHIILNISNISNLPVEILGAGIDDDIIFNPLEQNPIVQAKITSSPIQETLIPLTWTISDPSADTLSSIVVQYRILGSKNVRMTRFEISVKTSEKLVTRRPIQVLDQYVKENVIVLDTGYHCFDQDLVVPNGVKLIVSEGTTIDLIKTAGIISHSPIDLLGSKEKNIIITSSDSTGRGITVLNSQRPSRFQYVSFQNLSGSSYSNTSCAIYFENSPVKISHCHFEGNLDTNYILGVSKGDYSINNAFFSHSTGSAFYTELSTGTVRNTMFHNIGHSGITIVGAKVNLDDLKITNCQKVGIEALSGSEVNMNRLAFKKIGLCVLGRDQTKIKIETILSNDSEVIFAVFDSVPYTDPSSIEVLNYQDSQNPDARADCWIGDNCRISMNGRTLRSNIKKSSLVHLLPKITLHNPNKVISSL